MLVYSVEVARLIRDYRICLQFSELIYEALSKYMSFYFPLFLRNFTYDCVPIIYWRVGQACDHYLFQGTCYRTYFANNEHCTLITPEPLWASVLFSNLLYSNSTIQSENAKLKQLVSNT